MKGDYPRLSGERANSRTQCDGTGDSLNVMW